jgi:putative redox protein
MSKVEVKLRTLTGLAVEASTGRHRVLVDEPVEMGGAGSGTTPSQTLLAALGACAAMTMTLYAKRKGWPLEGVEIDASLERPDKPGPGQPQTIRQTIRLRGPLDAEQKERLREIAGKCPVHRTLEGPLVLEETLG